MSDDSDPARSSSVATADESGLRAVAQSMLGTVAAIQGAIESAMTHEAPGPGRDSLLLMAVRRLEFLTIQLRDIAEGVPGSAVVVDLRTSLEDKPGDAGA
jgi:hypothetical protein